MISRLYLRGVLADLTGPRDPDLPPNRLRFVGAGDFRAVGDEMVNLLTTVGGLRANVAQKHLACRGQPDPARLTLEQFGAELLFKIHDSAIDGGSRDVEPFRRLSDRAGACDFINILQ